MVNIKSFLITNKRSQLFQQLSTTYKWKRQEKSTREKKNSPDPTENTVDKVKQGNPVEK